jgi:hypothetical protein
MSYKKVAFFKRMVGILSHLKPGSTEGNANERNGRNVCCFLCGGRLLLLGGLLSLIRVVLTRLGLGHRRYGRGRPLVPFRGVAADFLVEAFLGNFEE